MFYRGGNTKQVPLNIVGSNTYGRYNSISCERTYNMYISDQWMVPYPGYKIGVPEDRFSGGGIGRGVHASANLNRLVTVIGDTVYLVQLTFNQATQEVISSEVAKIGNLQTSVGPVYITENNKPQILISDNEALYIYDPFAASGPRFHPVTGIDFVPGYVDFHDTYFIAAAIGESNWRLSDSNEGATKENWPSTTQHVGALETKPDRVQAVVRFPSRGNMVFVFGKTVTEAWLDTGAALFPYQRNNSYNIDYGCLNPSTIASIDELVVWLGINEKSGPVIMFSTGQMPEQITTDGIDFLLSNLQAPDDSQAFLFRQDGHIIYHINFYTDNISLFYDFTSKKFFSATDENMNYFIASSVSFFNNQYYFLSRNNGNLYAFDTIFYNYDGAEVPRARVCKNIRLPTQDYFIATDAGFTIECGETPDQMVDQGPLYLITEDGKKYITEGSDIFLSTEDDQLYITEDGIQLISQQVDSTSFNYLIAEQGDIVYVTPRIDMSISIDGGDHFSSYVSQDLPGIGKRKCKLMWWQLGAANDLVCQFRFYSFGRFVVTDGLVTIRT